MNAKLNEKQRKVRPSLVGEPYNPDDERFARLLDRMFNAGRRSGWRDCFGHYFVNKGDDKEAKP